MSSLHARNLVRAPYAARSATLAPTPCSRRLAPAPARPDRRDRRAARASPRPLAPLAGRARDLGPRRRGRRLVGAAPGAAAVPRQRRRVGGAGGAPSRSTRVATLVRGERWHCAAARRAAAEPDRADSHGLNVVGYAANNVLPARAGDAVRVFLMAPRARDVEEVGARDAARRAAARHRRDPRRCSSSSATGCSARPAPATLQLDPARDRRSRSPRGVAAPSLLCAATSDCTRFDRADALLHAAAARPPRAHAARGTFADLGPRGGRVDERRRRRRASR